MTKLTSRGDNPVRIFSAVFVACIATFAQFSHAAPDLDTKKFESVAAWVSYMLRENKPEMASRVVGSKGTRIVPYATTATPLGKNNANEVVAIFRKALKGSTPQCLGYDPKFGTLPDKAIIYVKGLPIEAPKEVTVGAGDVVGIQFFRIEGQWQLVWLTPIAPMFVPSTERLLSCPNNKKNETQPVGRKSEAPSATR